MKTSRDVMTTDVHVCGLNDTVLDAARLMSAAGVGAVPVVDEISHRLFGIVTDRDLAVRVVAEKRDATTTLVRDVMSTEPISCREDTPVSQVVDLMRSHQLRRIPVVTDEGKLAGIIALADIATRQDDERITARVLATISAAPPNEGRRATGADVSEASPDPERAADPAHIEH